VLNIGHGEFPRIVLAPGIKLANPDLTVIAFVGDGDAYAEGRSHIIHAARRNTEIMLIVHDNGVYGLTTGQFTPTSPSGFKGRSTPFGNVENPINPITLMLVSRASFVVRGFSGDIKHLEYIFEKAIFHKSFSFIDVFQPCITFNNAYEYSRERVYNQSPQVYKLDNYENAVMKSLEYGGKIPIGIFYDKENETFESAIRGKSNYFKEREIPEIEEILKEKV
jgi:2-oxoglutarate ferredoxin oxidoreductase subunit beta